MRLKLKLKLKLKSFICIALFIMLLACSGKAAKEESPESLFELGLNYLKGNDSLDIDMAIYQLSESFQLRGEFYGFVPIFPIKKDEYGQAYYGKAFTKFEYLGEISLVFQLSFGSISAYVNHYSSPSNDWNVGLTLGWQLFNSRFIE